MCVGCGIMNKVSKLLIVLLGSSVSILAYGFEVSPANFGTFTADFVEKLSFPKIDDGSPLTVKCAARISARGKFDSIVCFDDPGFKGERRISRSAGAAIAKIARNSRIFPARVDGRRVQVWYNFSVLYRHQGGEETIQIIDNHLRNQADYGTNYIAAQRYNARTRVCSGLRSAVIIRAAISESGEVANVSPLQENPSEANCTRKIIQAMEGSAYIPAYYEGDAVASTYIEIFVE